MNPGRTSVCDEPPHLRMKSILTLWKHCHLPSTPFPHKLQSCSSCSTSSFLSCSYKYWTKTCNRTWYGEKSNSSVPNRFSIIQSLPCCLFLKAMPLLHKTMLLPTQLQSYTPLPQLTLNFSNAMLNCELNSFL